MKCVTLRRHIFSWIGIGTQASRSVNCYYTIQKWTMWSQRLRFSLILGSTFPSKIIEVWATDVSFRIVYVIVCLYDPENYWFHITICYICLFIYMSSLSTHTLCYGCIDVIRCVIINLSYPKNWTGQYYWSFRLVLYVIP